MAMSKKLTFSLASLVLLMAFIAMPVMAHVVTGDTSTHVAAETHAAHPVIKSITAPKYTDGDAFEITVVFQAADADKKIAAPVALTSSNISISGSPMYPVALPGTNPDLTTQVIRFVSTNVNITISRC